MKPRVEGGGYYDPMTNDELLVLATSEVIISSLARLAVDRLPVEGTTL